MRLRIALSLDMFWLFTQINWYPYSLSVNHCIQRLTAMEAYCIHLKKQNLLCFFLN